ALSRRSAPGKKLLPSQQERAGTRLGGNESEAKNAGSSSSPPCTIPPTRCSCACRTSCAGAPRCFCRPPPLRVHVLECATRRSQAQQRAQRHKVFTSTVWHPSRGRVRDICSQSSFDSSSPDAGRCV